jgi:hypothetical protein
MESDRHYHPSKSKTHLYGHAFLDTFKMSSNIENNLLSPLRKAKKLPSAEDVMVMFLIAPINQ